MPKRLFTNLNNLFNDNHKTCYELHFIFEQKNNLQVIKLT